MISDYLEQNREKTGCRDVDPCMILGENLGRYDHADISHLLKAYQKAFTADDRKQRKIQLTAKIMELETIKAEYLLEEKMVLTMLNRGILQSLFMQNQAELLGEELRKSYHGICDLRMKIDHEIGEHITTEVKIRSDKELGEKLLHLTITSVLIYLGQKSTYLDTSEFRKIVADMAEWIKFIEKCDFNQPGKKIVRYYLEKEFGLKETQLMCMNCGSKLLEDIPYCFNCYERN